MRTRKTHFPVKVQSKKKNFLISDFLSNFIAGISFSQLYAVAFFFVLSTPHRLSPLKSNGTPLKDIAGKTARQDVVRNDPDVLLHLHSNTDGHFFYFLFYGGFDLATGEGIFQHKCL